ncbi:unnamed protein product [Pedinophyceae sp. YPF-701]|nr:unnamed protein product [Pedinophyceae sp. YPF-701]
MPTQIVTPIDYKPGTLRLLDQRKLPLVQEYLEVTSPQDAWQMIKDMVVRGAPAIGITGALALAEDLRRQRGTFASPADVSAHVATTMDFLVTSRPTAVNLADAAGRLKAEAARLAAPGGASDASAACDAMIAACEGVLHDDVRFCNAMGNAGADALLAATAHITAGRCVNVLTHCNTGALACGGIGTALGVIRVLHARGVLGHAYNTETRPYNQGARLTAFELVHEKIPATMVCDSAVSYLMAQGKVDAVVVGADRITANGDTANKIGTYQLALAARHHGLPFFVAAPTTTLDPALDHGGLIEIEQRPHEEMTTCPRTGQRVAAEGIGIWNPSFDVTPQGLITGIVTEHGLIPRKEGGGGFDVRGFLSQHGQEVPGGSDRRVLETKLGYRDLDEAGVCAYVAERPGLARLVAPEGSDPATWKVREVGDGNINYVFIVEGPLGGIVVKQGRPYIRLVGESWPLTQDRIRLEAQALREEGRWCPEHTPKVYHLSENLSLFVMEYIPPPHSILRHAVCDGGVFPHLAEHASKFLAHTLFHTSLLYLSTAERADLAARFRNPEMCRLTEQVVFTDPYFPADINKHTSPQLDADVADLRADARLKAAAAEMKRIFCECGEALVHGDLHTGSIMCTEATTYVIDAEFVFLGPMGFDVGALLANLLLAFYATDGRSAAAGGGADDRAAQRKWLLRSVGDIWRMFVAEFEALWAKSHGGDALRKEVFGHPLEDAAAEGAASRLALDAWTRRLLADSLGFAGCKMIRRIVGIAHVADLEGIEDADRRAVCERRALKLGRALLTQRSAFESIERVLELAEEIRKDGAQPYSPL